MQMQHQFAVLANLAQTYTIYTERTLHKTEQASEGQTMGHSCLLSAQIVYVDKQIQVCLVLNKGILQYICIVLLTLKVL